MVHSSSLLFICKTGISNLHICEHLSKILILEEIDCFNDCSTDCPGAILVNANTCAQGKFWVRSGRINNILNSHLKHHLNIYEVVHCLESLFPILLFASKLFEKGSMIWNLQSKNFAQFVVCTLMFREGKHDIKSAKQKQ